eukprot:g30099.t1
MADLDALFSSDTEEEQKELKCQRKIRAAETFKEEGNSFLKQEQLDKACVSYRRALSKIWALYRQRSVVEAVDLGVRLDLNLALVYLKVERYESARRCATRVLEVEPENAKALFRPVGSSAACASELQDLGLAEGVFFSPLRVEGPSVEDAPKMGAPSGEMLALLAGKDKRLIPVPSFTSLGVTQRWLLGKLPSEGHTREIALDPTSSALGLEPLHLATEDERTSARADERSYAVGMLSDMERNGVPPDTITYNAAIMALSLNKRWKEAVELIAEMWAAKIFPDVISYTSAISACASTGHWKEALQLLAETLGRHHVGAEPMERAGIKADVRIFNAAINACAQAGQSSRALQLLDGMSERLLVPDIVSYNAAINACAQNGEYESAFKLLERMKSQGLRPQTRTYNSALNACEKAFRAEETLQLLDDMVETKTRPDIVTFNTAMSACLKGGMQGQALSLLEDVSGVGRPEMAPWAPVVGSRDVGDRYVGREAQQRYVKLRQLVRETFESFLRSLNSQSLKWLEQQFELHGGNINSAQFLKIFSKVCPRLESSAFSADERKMAMKFAVLKLFEGMDVDTSGETSWMEFAVAEELRLKAQELSGQIFEFSASVQVVLPAYRPTVTKCHFDKLFYWPGLPMECAVVFEEGQASFFLHRQQSMLRRRRVDGHQSDLLSAAFLQDINLVVTSGNDKTLCFWAGAPDERRRPAAPDRDPGAALHMGTWDEAARTGEGTERPASRMLVKESTYRASYRHDGSLPDTGRAGLAGLAKGQQWADVAAEESTAFNLVKRWSLKDVAGVLCWCAEINALYAADHFTERFWGWRILDELEVKTTGHGGMKPEKALEFKVGHSKAIQVMKWLEPLQCLATASLDTTVQIFDTVLQGRTHVAITPKDFVDASTFPVRMMVHHTALRFLNYMVPNLKWNWKDFSRGAEQAIRTVHEHLATGDVESLRGLLTDGLLEELKQPESPHHTEKEEWCKPPRLMEINVLGLFSSSVAQVRWHC